MLPVAASLLEMLRENQFQVILEMLPDVSDGEETWGSLLLQSLYALGCIMNFPFIGKLNENLRKRQQSKTSQIKMRLRLFSWSMCMGGGQAPGGDRHCLYMWFVRDSWPMWQTLLMDIPSLHCPSCPAPHCQHSLKHWVIWRTAKDTGWDHTELEARTSTLSPRNFMPPDKITSLLDVLVLFFVFFF